MNAKNAQALVSSLLKFGVDLLSNIEKSMPTAMLEDARQYFPTHDSATSRSAWTWKHYNIAKLLLKLQVCSNRFSLPVLLFPLKFNLFAGHKDIQNPSDQGGH